ncbi:hypothetical protein [Dinghuibacter silviterrae]|uniref:Uncharacterized protein n=1 Tax=Dinghuibacter silviterrae TaxID=1539049 RepID=A0A4R8DFF3_9BACT|nr:hypothetical protein [Dinghuibacter silviterrae]TDW96333.1 hypothetical protein EDB95_4159 [Dinghuibacter silviterrae]
MKHIAIIVLLLLTGGRVFAVFSEAHWRWRKDNGPQAGATWRASQDFPGTIMDSAGIRLRIEVYNGTGNNEMGTVGLQYRMDTTGTWINVSNTVSAHDFVMSGSSPYVTDGEPVTMQVNDPGAGTFEGGRVLVSTFSWTDTLNAGTKKEYEWCIKPTGTYSPDSLYQFRMTYTGTTDGFNYVSPLPDMMIRPAPDIPGNAGIYLDPNVTAFFNRDSGWIASDGAATIPLSDGRILWAMDDSYINNFDTLGGTMPCLFQVHNDVLAQPYNNWNWVNTPTLLGDSASVPSYLKNNSNNNYYIWPNAGYQRGDTVYVYGMNIMAASGGLGFASGGNDFLAKISFPSLTVVGFDTLQNFNGISFGIGFDTAERGNYIYTWGVKGSGFITGNMYVARFARNNPGGPWNFWNGSSWDTSAAKAAVIATAASNGAYIAKVRNKYVFLSTQFTVGCNAGTIIYSSTSDSITGPFSALKPLYTITDNVLGNTPFFYGPQLHPEYINSHNEILITYDINGYGNCEPFCINNGADPDYYRPRGLRVPLALIDSSIAESDSTWQALAHLYDGGRWNVRAFPNPFHSCVNMSMSNCPDRFVNLLLYDAMGSCVYRERVGVDAGALNHTIYLRSGTSRGMYFLVVQGETASKFVKVVVQ